MNREESNYKRKKREGKIKKKLNSKELDSNNNTCNRDNRRNNRDRGSNENNREIFTKILSELPQVAWEDSLIVSSQARHSLWDSDQK